MVDALIELVSDMPPGWRVFFLSMFPVTELRGAIPLGLLWDLEPLSNYLWAVAGNFVPLIPLLLFLRYFSRFLLDRPRWQKLGRWMRQKAIANQDRVQRYGMLGLCVLVAIPLPGTGVWTGALVASLLRLPFLPATIAITIGELIAGALVTLVMTGAIAVAQLHSGEWILAGILLFLIFFLWKKFSK